MSDSYDIDVSQAIEAVQKLQEQVDDLNSSLNIEATVQTQDATQNIEGLEQAMDSAGSSAIGLGAAFSAMFGTIGVVVGAVLGLVATLTSAGDAAFDLNQKLKGAVFKPLDPKTIDELDEFTSSFSALFDIITQTVVKLTSDFSGPLSSGMRFVVEIALEAYNLFENIKLVVVALAESAIKSFGGVSKSIGGIVVYIYDAVHSLYTLIKDFVGSIITLLDPILPTVDTVLSTIREIVKKVLWGIISFTTGKIRILLGMLEFLADVLNLTEIRDSLDKAGASLAELGTTIPDSLFAFYDNAAEAISNITFKTIDSVGAADKLIKISKNLKLQERYSEAADAAEAHAEEVNAIAEAFRGLLASIDPVIAAENELADIQRQYGQYVAEGVISQDEYNKVIASALDNIRAAKDEQSGLTEAMDKYLFLVDSVKTSVELYQDELKKLQPLLEAGKIKEYNKAVELLQDSYREIAQEVEIVATKTEVLFGSASQLFGAAGFGGLSGVLENLSTLTSNTVEPLDKMVTSIGMVSSGLGALYTGIDSVVKMATGMDLMSLLFNPEEFVGDISDAITSIDFKGLLRKLVIAIRKIIPEIAEALPSVLDGILAALPGFLDTIINVVIPILIDLIEKLVVKIVDFLPQLAAMIPDLVLTLVESVLGALPTIIQALVAAIPMIITELVFGLIGALPQLIQAIVDSVPVIISAIFKGLVQATIELIARILEAVGWDKKAENLRARADTLSDGSYYNSTGSYQNVAVAPGDKVTSSQSGGFNDLAPIAKTISTRIADIYAEMKKLNAYGKQQVELLTAISNKRYPTLARRF